MPPPDINDKANYFHWRAIEPLDCEEFRAAARRARAAFSCAPAQTPESAAAQPSPAEARANPPSDASEELCMVCWEAKPATFVLPCLRRVVCRACSEALQKTGDRRTCVACRRNIEAVVDSDGNILSSFP
jgi:hypothetical protein